MGDGSNMNHSDSHLNLPDRQLAFQQRNASAENCGKPGIVFLGGFASDMTGTKATDLDARCAQAGLAFLRFDYRGHGASSGKFEDYCIGDWLDDTLQIFDALTKGPQIVVGSSMGGWLGLHLARARGERVAGFVGIAAAPDFTEDLILPVLTDGQRVQLAQDGYTYDLDAPPDFRIPVTSRLLEDGKNHLLLREPLELNKPVHLLQGQADREVPWRYALRIADTIASDNVRVTLVKDGDHRLSRPQDMDLIWQTITAMLI